MLIYFYKIIADGSDGEEYIGSTEKTIERRFTQHKSEYKNNLPMSNSKILFEKHGVDACRIELTETRECATDEERWKYEGELIRASLNCVNERIAGGMTKDEINAQKRAYYETHREEVIAKCSAYYHANKDERSAKSREYYQTHKDEINARQRERRRQARLLGNMVGGETIQNES